MQNTKGLKAFIESKDYTVSKETFTLYHNKEYDMLITSPQPDVQDLPKYYQSEDYISHTDARRSLFEKVYHLVKSYALQHKTNLINKLNKTPGVLLDIGAGTGDFLVNAKNRNWEVLGTEPNIEARELADEKGIVLQATSTIFEDEKFDVITMWHVLEHIPDLKEQIIELKRLLKQNGHIVIAVPNFKSYDASYYKSFWAAYDVPRHLWHFSQESIKKLFTEQHMAVVATIPMKFDSFYVSLLSEKYKTSNMNFIKASWIGLRSNLKAMQTKEYSSLIYVIKKEKNAI